MTNPGADRVRKIHALTTASGRRRQGAYIVEGPQAVREAIAHSPGEVVDVYLSVPASQRYPELIDGATAQGLYLHLCSPEVLEAMSADSQGVVAVLQSPSRAEISFEYTGAQGGQFYAGLVQARDPGNTGAIIRAADAAGAAGVILTEGSVAVENPKVVRATAGSLFHLPVMAGANVSELIEHAQHLGVRVLATSGRGEYSLPDLTLEEELSQPTLWLFGNEAHGLPQEVLLAADATVSIPIYGHAESLNLAMAATLCLYASAKACVGAHKE